MSIGAGHCSKTADRHQQLPGVLAALRSPAGRCGGPGPWLHERPTSQAGEKPELACKIMRGVVGVSLLVRLRVCEKELVSLCFNRSRSYSSRSEDDYMLSL